MGGAVIPGRRPRRCLSLRTCLVVLVVVCLVPMVMFSVWLTVAIARDQRAALRERMQDTARALAIAVDRDLREDVHTLQAVAASRALDAADLGAVSEELRAVAASQNQWLAITVYTPDGRRVLDTVRPLDPPAVGGPDEAGVRRVIETGDPVVSGPTDFGPDSFAVRVPVVRGGRLHYVMSATVSGAAVGEIFRRQGLPARWIGSLVDGRGVALARTGHATLPAGRTTGFPPAATGTREGWGGRVGLPQGVFYFAYARPELTTWRVILAAPVAALDGPWLRSLGAIVGAGVAFLAIGVGLATLACRPIARSLTRLGQAAADLGRGRTPAPIDSPVADLEAVGRDLAAAGHARDRAERGLRAREAQLAALVHQATAGIAQTDLAGRFVLVNRRYCDLVGREPDEVVRLSIPEVVHAEDRPRVTAAVRDLTVSEPEVALEARYTRPDGSSRWVDATLSLVQEAGEPHSIAVVALDATDRHVAESLARAGDAERGRLLAREGKARREAEAASRAKDEFLAVVSHELRTPLNALRLWAGILKAEPDPQTIARAVDTIDRNVLHQTRLIEDLLDVSRVVSGRLRLAVERVDLTGIIADVIETGRAAADNRDIELTSALDPETGPVLGDPTRLRQVVWNLLSNAVRFTPAGGRVEVALTRSGRDARLTVIDTGRGIDPVLLPLVFDRFHQGETGPARSHGGLGIGLSIARQIVELHGGTIEAASAGAGRGARFTVCLPLAVPFAARGPAPSPGPDRRRERRLQDVHVLAVDDDAETREVMRMALSLEGAEVTTASSVADALAVVERRWPDVLLSDIAMPGEDGLALVRELRRREALRDRRVPAIALTARAGATDARRAIEAGYEAYVVKPVEAAALAPLILSLLPGERRA